MSATRPVLEHDWLGASRKAAGEPTAEHLPPQALGAGPSLPLVTPKSAPASTGPYDWKNM